MTFLDYIAEKGFSIYRLSKDSGIPLTTLQDIASGEKEIEDCKGRTLLPLARTLETTVENLMQLEPEESGFVIPDFLAESIREYRVAVRKRSTMAGEYSEQLRSTINVAEVEHAISSDTAERLRKRYYFK